MELYEFKAKQLAKLLELEAELKQKYPDKAARVRELVQSLLVKLDNLRSVTLYDYLRTVTLCEAEFPEFRRLIPKPEELEKLLLK